MREYYSNGGKAIICFENNNQVGYINTYIKLYRNKLDDSYHSENMHSPKPATPNQIKHYLACEKANRYIPFEEINENTFEIW